MGINLNLGETILNLDLNMGVSFLCCARERPPKPKLALLGVGGTSGGLPALRTPLRKPGGCRLPDPPESRCAPVFVELMYF